MITTQHIESLDPQQQRQTLPALLAEVMAKDAIIQRRRPEAAFKRAPIGKLNHEMAALKRLKFSAQSEKCAEAFNAEQKSLIEEAIDADLAALAKETESLDPVKPAPQDKQQHKQQALPAKLCRREIQHVPQSTTGRCGCQLKRIGQDAADQLDHQPRPGSRSRARLSRGGWASVVRSCSRWSMRSPPIFSATGCCMPTRRR